ncbi:MAG: SDR family oxidoreductase, partial [Planctomycetales bacterium]
AAHDGDPKILYRAADAADRESVDALVAWATKELGRIDIFINSAGVNIVKRTMAEMIPEDWDKVLQINASGAYYCMHAVLPPMRERGDGLIINVSSIAGKRSSPLGGVAYSAAKFAMTALGGTVALEDGKNGIRVTTIFPGEVNTPILDNRPVAVSDEHRARILQPEDVAAAALMIACLPPRAHVPELIIKPVSQDYA